MNTEERFGLNINFLRWLRWTSDTKLGLLGDFPLGAEEFLTRQVEQIVHLDDFEEKPDDVSCFVVNHGDGDMDSLRTTLGALDFEHTPLLLVCGNGEGAWQQSTCDSDTDKVSLSKLNDFFEAAELNYRIYYVYPDFYACKYLFSDECLPQPEMISIKQWKGRDEDSTETELLEKAVESGNFPQAARGFVCLAWRKAVPWQTELPRLVKFSNLRRKTTAVYTSLTSSEVWKTASWPEGNLHIDQYVDHADLLREQYREAGIGVSECRREGYSAVSVIAQGRSLRDILDECYQNQDEKFFAYVEDYIHRVKLANSNGYFDYSNEFRAMFGRQCLPVGLRSGTYNNLDLIFDNIIISDSGEWSMIDHEWTVEFPVPYEFILWRAIAYYFQLRAETAQYKSWKVRSREMAGITEETWVIYRNMEQKFQAYLLQGI